MYCLDQAAWSNILKNRGYREKTVEQGVGRKKLLTILLAVSNNQIRHNAVTIQALTRAVVIPLLTEPLFDQMAARFSSTVHQ